MILLNKWLLIMMTCWCHVDHVMIAWWWRDDGVMMACWFKGSQGWRVEIEQCCLDEPRWRCNTWSHQQTEMLHQSAHIGLVSHIWNKHTYMYIHKCTHTHTHPLTAETVFACQGNFSSMAIFTTNNFRITNPKKKTVKQADSSIKNPKKEDPDPWHFWVD